MEKQRAKKEKVRLQRDAAAAAAAALLSARRPAEYSEPGPVLQEQRKTERHKSRRLGVSSTGGQLQQGKPELPVDLK